MCLLARTHNVQSPMWKATLKLFLFWNVYTIAHSTWSGEFRDTTFGGSLFVCLSEVIEADTSVSTIGQGVFSRFGYMRGPVLGNTWMGDYFMAGLEARHGTFNFTLVNDGLAYTGDFSESVGHISYGMSGIKLSAVGYLPANTDCFKSDDGLLTLEAAGNEYSFTGNAVATNIASGALQDRVAYSDDNGHVSVSWTASWGVGYNYGPSFVGGQVVCAQWYEANANEGIELFVAKNTTSFYSIWLISPSVSMYNYTQVVEIDASYGVETNELVNTAATADQGQEFSYLRLLTEPDENTCSQALAGDSLNCDSSDSDDTFSVAMLLSALVVTGGLNVFFLVYINTHQMQGGAARLVEEKGSSDVF